MTAVTAQLRSARARSRHRAMARGQSTRDGAARDMDVFRPVTLCSPDGVVFCRSYPVPGARAAVAWVGGIGGDWDSPANGLYSRLAGALREDGIASLRVRYRIPANLSACTRDLVGGVEHLTRAGAAAVALVGHSFGGAVVVSAADACAVVRAVVTLATQGQGTDAVERLTPRCALLAVHGTADEVLPQRCSEDLFRRAGEPKRLVLYEGAGHGLDEAADELDREVGSWLRLHL